MEWHYEYQDEVICKEDYRSGVYMVYQKEIFDKIMKNGKDYGFEYEYICDIPKEYLFESLDGKLVYVPDTVVKDNCELHDLEIEMKTKDEIEPW